MSLALFTDVEEDDVGDVISWYSPDGQPTVNGELSADQPADVDKLLTEYSDVFSN